MTESAIARKYVATREGVEKVRITRSGEVHAYGVMPNTNISGWYFAGDVDTLVSMSLIEKGLT